MVGQIDTNSISFRFVLIAALTLAALIPLGLVSCVTSDRSENYELAAAAIGDSWGNRQQVGGPVVMIPIDEADDDTGAHVVVMPETLELTMATSHEYRRRGIFEVPVFEVEITANGEFSGLDMESLQQRFGALRFDQAFVAIGISDTTGIRSADIRWRGQELEIAPLPKGPIDSGISAPPTGLVAETAELAFGGGNFEIDLNLRGTRRFSVAPTGNTSTITMSSTWPHPSFIGRILPDKRDVGPDGFTASYTMSALARGLPEIFRSTSMMGNTLFIGEYVGFSALEPVNLYSSVERSIKYGILFVALTLVGLLCLELSTAVRFHFVHYAVTIIALALFFMTLLALAEYIGFTPSYLLSAALLTTMITWYAHGSIKKRRLTALVGAMLVALYSVMFLLLRLESYSLLVGTAVLLLTLGILMRTTRQLKPVAEGEGKD